MSDPFLRKATVPVTPDTHLNTNGDELPVVVIGAGPIGLSAAANLIDRGIDPMVLECGDAVGANLRDWAHVELFSPWEHVVDPVAERLLVASGWQRPPDAEYPTGGDIVYRVLEPLAALPAMAKAIRLQHTVRHVSRLGVDKVRAEGREEFPFLVIADTPDGEIRVVARAVVDASGTWNQPNPIGSGGVPAIGERALQKLGRIAHGIPDVLGAERPRYADKRVAVIGSGHSAQNAVRDLAELAALQPGTQITWIVRRSEAGQMFGGGIDDQLPARGALGADAKRLAASDSVDFVTGFRVEEVIDVEGEVYLVSTEGVKAGPFDEIIASTGARPDLGMTRELRLDIDPGIESTTAMAPLIDPNYHSCGSVPPHGVAELSHPDVGYYAIGNKSYGRAPTFLLLTGYEQARSVVAEIAGDHEAARRIDLVLPETGVCNTKSVETSERERPVIQVSPSRDLPSQTSTAASCCG